jgi:hypothetical protein
VTTVIVGLGVAKWAVRVVVDRGRVVRERGNVGIGEASQTEGAFEDVGDCRRGVDEAVLVTAHLLQVSSRTSEDEHDARIRAGSCRARRADADGRGVGPGLGPNAKGGELARPVAVGLGGLHACVRLSAMFASKIPLQLRPALE